MAKIYYRRIVAEAMIIDEVPDRWRAETQELFGCEMISLKS